MRLIYLGTPPFAVPILEAIIRAGHDVLEVISQPDRPQGRAQAVRMPAVKQCALAHGLPTYQPERIRRPEAVEHLRAMAPEMMVVVGYGQILPQAVIDIAPHGILNVHASLLPRLRGAAPIQWAIVNGERETGVTTMRIDAGMDTGEMLLKASTAIGPDEDAIALAERLSHMGAELLIETLEQVRRGSLRPEKQDAALATYAPILKKEDGRMDWNWPAARLHNLVRGLQPWPGAQTMWRGNLFHVWITRLAEYAWPGAPGELRFNRDGLFAAAGDGRWLKLMEVQMEGRKKMSAEDFARGQRVMEDERLG